MFFTQYAKKYFFFFFFTFFDFFDFFDFLEWKYDFLGLMEHFINIFVTKWIKKKKNRIFFWLFRENFDFLGLRWLFFYFFLLFGFDFLGLTFWVPQYVKHVKIVSSGPGTTHPGTTQNHMAQGTYLVTPFLYYSWVVWKCTIWFKSYTTTTTTSFTTTDRV